MRITRSGSELKDKERMMEGYRKIIALICTILISAQTYTVDLQKLHQLGRNICNTRALYRSNKMKYASLRRKNNVTPQRSWMRKTRNNAQTTHQFAHTPRVIPQVKEPQTASKNTSWWSALYRSCRNLFATQKNAYNTRTQQWHKQTKEFSSSRSDKQKKVTLIAATLLGGGTIAGMFEKKSRVIYADDFAETETSASAEEIPEITQNKTAHPPRITSFRIDEKEMKNPKLMRAKLAQYHEDQHPEVAIKAIEYLNSFLNWRWQWALKKALHNAPESTTLLINFIAPHCAYVADNSQHCIPVLAYIMKEKPELVKPIQDVIEQNRQSFEQTKHGKKVLATLNMK